MHKLKHIKDSILDCLQAQVDCNLKNVNTKELGEVVDMVKDLEEAMYYCSIVEAMEEEKDSSEWLRDIDKSMGKLYYDNPYLKLILHSDPAMMSRRMYTDYPINGEHPIYDTREGHSGRSRKAYLEAKEHHDEQMQMKELEKYIQDLSTDLTEMIADASTAEKQMLQQKLAALSAKVK